jgi:glycosyltransferase involved in cell wall biosynthesis
VKIGDRLTSAQSAMATRLGLEDALVELGKQPTEVLVAMYRRARAVVLTSDAEGFGLPALEALACGAVVVASDIDAFREVGGEAVVFAQQGDAASFTHVLESLLSGRMPAPSPELRAQTALRYTWRAHADVIAAAYERYCPGVQRAG